MATIQYTQWVNAPVEDPSNPISVGIELTPPVVSFVPPTPFEGERIGTRAVQFQWTANKSDCLFKYKYGAAWSADWQTTVTFEVDSIPNGEYSFSVKAIDKYGNESTVATRNFTVYRELPTPTPIAPALDAILPVANVAFVCTVPSGEEGQAFHFEFQIATNASMTQFVEEREWFSSKDGYSGFSYTAPVLQNQGGTVSFTKTLNPRKKYWWRCRVRLAGTDKVGLPSGPLSFTVGTLATKLIVSAEPVNVRADGRSLTTVSAKAVDRLGNVDLEWVGAATFSVIAGNATFVGSPNAVPFSSGIAITQATSLTVNNVTIKVIADYLTDGSAVVNFVANRLPAAPVWLSAPINPTEVATNTATLSCTIPVDLDNDQLHMKIEIDTDTSFTSPDLIVAETRFSLVGWEYYDSANWKPFPTDGVPQGLPGGIVRYTTPDTLVDGKTYHCRMAAWDGVER